MEGGEPDNPEKNPRSKNENQQQTQPTYDAGSVNGTRAILMGDECSHHCATPAPPSQIPSTLLPSIPLSFFVSLGYFLLDSHPLTSAKRLRTNHSFRIMSLIIIIMRLKGPRATRLQLTSLPLDQIKKHDCQLCVTHAFGSAVRMISLVTGKGHFSWKYSFLW